MNTSKNNSGWSGWLASITAGALIMYFSDPDRGRRRRALVRDQVDHWAREAGCTIDVSSRDLANRLQGIRARIRNLMTRRGEEPADDVLAQRVRARLGRVTSHPRAVKVLAQQGWVNLYGVVLEHEREDVLDAVTHTPGVTGVSDNMQAYATPEHIPSLQGHHEVQRSRSGFAPTNWSPSTRALVALGGFTLGGYGLLRRTPANAVLAALGLGLVASRVLTNPRLPRYQSAAGPVESREEAGTRQAAEAASQTHIPLRTEYPPVGGSSIH